MFLCCFGSFVLHVVMMVCLDLVFVWFGFGICLDFPMCLCLNFGLFVVRFVCGITLDALWYWWLCLILFGCCALIISGLFIVFDLFGFYVAF